MQNIASTALLLGGSWASGINLYLTVATLGIASRYDMITLPGSLNTIEHPLVITVAIALFAIEFFADKIPYVDSVWDSIHTFVRPAGGALLAYMASSELYEPAQAAISLAAGTLAFDSHLTKATSRAVINTSPEPVTNSVASVTEDAGVLGALYLVMKHPIVAIVLVILFVLFSIWFLTKMFKVVKSLFKKNKVSS